MVYLLSLLLALPLSATAAPITVPPNSAKGVRHRVDFIPAGESLAEQGLPANLAEAVPMLNTGPSPASSSRCSAAFISDQGHILTAGHCLSSCLPPDAYEFTESHGYTLRKIKQAAWRDGKLVCNLGVNGVRGRYKVLAANWCSTRGSEEGDFTSALPAIEKCEQIPDYAILQSEAPSDTKACVAVLPASVPVGEKALLLGYPANTNRKLIVPEARDSTGQGLFASVGKRVDQPYCEVRGPGGRTGKQDISVQQKLKKGYVQADLDMVPGNSGGPLLSSELKVSGVAGAIANSIDWKFLECRGMSFFTSPELIIQDLSDLPSESTAAIFNCQDKLVQKGQAI